MEYKISLVVCIYNKEEYLPRMIDSIISQNISGCEIILVDDGSTDSSPSICDDYAERYDNIVVLHNKNGGLSDARNSGMRVARGKYISFPDSDDYYFPEKFGKLVNNIGDADAYFFGWAEEKGDTIYDKCDNLPTHREISGKNCYSIVAHPWNGYRGYAWNKLFKRELVSDILFDTRFSHAEDLLWLCAVAHRFEKIVLSNECVYSHVFYDGSLSHHSIMTEKDLNVFTVRRMIIDEIPDLKGKRIAQMAYHWDYLNILNNEIESANEVGINLVKQRYDAECEREYLQMTSFRGRIITKMTALFNK